MIGSPERGMPLGGWRGLWSRAFMGAQEREHSLVLQQGLQGRASKRDHLQLRTRAGPGKAATDLKRA